MPLKLKYIYLEPKIKASSVFLILAIILIVAFIMLKWNYIYSNWEEVKCKNSNFYIAPLFGKNSAETFTECIKNIETEIIDSELEPVNNQLNNLDSEIIKMNNKLNNSVDNVTEMNSSEYNGVLNISSKIQQNIANVKNALSKILGSVVLSTYMTNGTIQSSQNLGNNILNDVVNNFQKSTDASSQDKNVYQ